MQTSGRAVIPRKRRRDVFVRRVPSMAGRLPAEILHIICEEVAHISQPQPLFGPSDEERMLADRKRPNNLAKLALVNRHWYRVASVSLYYRIRIESTRQLRSLVEALRKNSCYKDYVRIFSVDFQWDFTMSLTPCRAKGLERSRREGITRGLLSVLGKFKRLLKLQVGLSLWPLCDPTCIVMQGQPIFPSMASTVTSLHLSEPTEIHQPILQSLKAVRTLHITNISAQDAPRFPKWDLRTLRMTRGLFFGYQLDPLFLSRHLSFLSLCDVLISFKDCHRVLSSVAPQLRSLEFLPSLRTQHFTHIHYNAFMETFLPQCTSLETINAYFVPSITSAPLPPKLVHVSLVHIPYRPSAVVNKDLEALVACTHRGMKTIALDFWPRRHLPSHRLTYIAEMRDVRLLIKSSV